MNSDRRQSIRLLWIRIAGIKAEISNIREKIENIRDDEANYANNEQLPCSLYFLALERIEQLDKGIDYCISVNDDVLDEIIKCLQRAVI